MTAKPDGGEFPNDPNGRLSLYYLDTDELIYEGNYDKTDDGTLFYTIPPGVLYERGVKFNIYEFSDHTYSGQAKFTGYYEAQKLEELTEPVYDSNDTTFSYQPAISPTRIEIEIGPATEILAIMRRNIR